MVKEIETVEEFRSEIQKDKVLVDFNAIWCGPCQMLSPTIEEISEEHPEINVISVDVDRLEEIAAEYRVMSIPLVVYLEKGKIINSSLGYVSKDQIVKLFEKI